VQRPPKKASDMTFAAYLDGVARDAEARLNFITSPAWTDETRKKAISEITLELEKYNLERLMIQTRSRDLTLTEDELTSDLLPPSIQSEGPRGTAPHHEKL
jgi:hypothetical protein